MGGHLTWKCIYTSSIDICQFSITSLFNSGDDRHRSISFRSVILIMIYAGTIILNLLAASVDSKFPVASNLSAENSTLPSVMEPAEKDNSVLVAPPSVPQMTNLFIEPLLLDFFQDNAEMVYLWNTLSIARSFGAIIGWLMVSSMNTDLLYDTLVEMDKYHVHP